MTRWLERQWQAFTPLSVERLLPRIQDLTDELIDKLAPLGAAELMSEFAIPLTIRTVASIMGVEPLPFFSDASAPPSSRWVAKLWRITWGVTLWNSPAFLA